MHFDCKSNKKRRIIKHFTPKLYHNRSFLVHFTKKLQKSFRCKEILCNFVKIINTLSKKEE